MRPEATPSTLIRLSIRKRQYSDDRDEADSPVNIRKHVRYNETNRLTELGLCPDRADPWT